MTGVITDLSGQLALVTGATGGIGSATCRCLAQLNCSLAIHYRSATDTAESLVKEFTSMGVNAQSFQADLSSYDETRKLHEQVVQAMGHPTILFNNAGMSGRSGVKAVEEVTIEEFEAVWRTNCGTSFLLTQLCMPAMVKAEWGRIVFCSSVAGFTGGKVGPHYASSKSAMHGLIHWLASAYAKKGITVNGVAPALIDDTKIIQGIATEQMAASIPVGRLGRPEEVAETVLWLVKNGFMTNKVIGVDGGIFVQ